jgi:hypothetical protein
MRSTPCWGPGEGMGRCIGPRPRAPAHVAIKMLGHPYAQEPALVARFTQEIVAGLRQRLRGGHAPSGHEGMEAQSAATAPASRCRSGTTRPAARPASWSTTPTSKSGGRATAAARSWSAAASSATDVLTGRAAPARVGATVLRSPVARAVSEPPRVQTLLANSSLVVAVTWSGPSGCRWMDGHGARRSAMSLRPEWVHGDPR